MNAARTLFLAILTIQSSYEHDLEEPASAVPDTLQWWIGGGIAWRVRTFALDRDLSVRRLALPDAAARELAEMQVRTTYGRVLGELHVIEIGNSSDTREHAAALRARGLSGSLVLAEEGFAYWSPDGAPYSAQSRRE